MAESQYTASKAKYQINVGDVFTRLQVVAIERKNYNRYAICDCECGTRAKRIRVDSLYTGAVLSCGCLNRERMSALHLAKSRRPMSERFWEKVNKDGPIPAHRPDLGACWEWQRQSRSDYGYGLFEVRNKLCVVAHRVSYILTNGDIPTGLCVCHHCDNPPCVNPSHLFLGTKKDNAQDCSAKRRFKASRLTPNQISEIQNASGLCREIAERFQISATSVGQIRRGIIPKRLASEG